MNAGSDSSPLQSLTHALKEIKTPIIIQLAPGTYSTASGETFPLVIPDGVIVVGDEANKGQGIVILGSGHHHSPSFGLQNATIVLQDNAQLMGVTVTNPAAKGSGVWIESSAPTLANNTFSNCGREGVFVSGTAKPAILDNVFVQNLAGGLMMAGNSQGEVLRNIFQKNLLGIAVSDLAAPLVAHNTLSNNVRAIALSRVARPVLRHNRITQNTQGGLLVNGNATPDLGSAQDPGGNIFQDNQQFDIQNTTSGKLTCAGNQLSVQLVKGLVEIIDSTEDVAPQISIGTQFSDMVEHWAEAFVEALVSQGLMSGFSDGTFVPNAPITRAHFAAIIAKTFHLPRRKSSPQFIDLQPNFWATPAIISAAEMGFVDSFPDGTFRPTQNLTKLEAIISMINGLKLHQGNPNVLSVYRDRAQIPSYATHAVATATQKLLVVNYPQTDQLQPLQDITRAEVAAMIYQALVTSGKAKALPCPYIVHPNLDIPSYSDLVGHWAEAFIRALVNMNLTSSFADGTYRPDKPMTRAQYAALVAAAFEPIPRRPDPQFTDVPKDFWAYRAILMAAQGGFVGGFSDRTFRPDQNVQRLQVIVSLVNGLTFPVAHTDAILRYKDYDTIPSYAHNAVATATLQRIVVNYPDPKQIQVNQAATRGEVAAMVYQALVATKRTSPILSPYIVSSCALET